MRNISTLLGKQLRDIRSECRLLLTGTPIQNKLQDLWALMDFAQPGLLGNHATFVKEFSDKIEKFQQMQGARQAAELHRDATAKELEEGSNRVEVAKEVLVQADKALKEK